MPKSSGLTEQQRYIFRLSEMIDREDIEREALVV